MNDDFIMASFCPSSRFQLFVELLWLDQCFVGCRIDHHSKLVSTGAELLLLLPLRLCLASLLVAPTMQAVFKLSGHSGCELGTVASLGTRVFLWGISVFWRFGSIYWFLHWRLYRPWSLAWCGEVFQMTELSVVPQFWKRVAFDNLTDNHCALLLDLASSVALFSTLVIFDSPAYC